MSERAIPLKHRDLSWIQFNERVLEEANDPANPLFERLKFLAITSSNLDEFFMIRYPSLIKSIQNARKSGSEETSELVRTRAEILRNVESFVLKQKQTLSNLQQQLAPEGIRIHRGVTEPLPASAKEVFDSRVLPALTPPEPYTVARLSLIPSLQQAVAFGKEALFLIPRTIPLVHVEQTGAELEVYFLDDLLLNFLGPAFQIAAPALLFRVTRDGDFTVEIKEEDPESIPDAVRVGLGVREKGRPVRIQARGASVSPLLNEISGHLKLVKDQIFVSSCPLALAGLSAVSGAAEKFEPKIQPLRYPRVEPYVPASLEIGDSVFQRIAREDILLHHPYDSFDAYVAWIRASSVDPAVERIEQTVYRMDALSPVIDALKSAAKSKTVRVLIELRARFDELNNLRLADELRKAGVQVAFGFGKLKLHAKVALVTRREGEGRRLYAHFSTGNY
ncbi:MAG: hypothetical protein ACXWP5_09935, partial [Bdellovibrionota bacterium]